MAPPPPLPRRTLRLGVTAGWQPDASSAEFDVRLSPRALVAILGLGAAARSGGGVMQSCSECASKHELQLHSLCAEVGYYHCENFFGVWSALTDCRDCCVFLQHDEKRHAFWQENCEEGAHTWMLAWACRARTFTVQLGSPHTLRPQYLDTRAGCSGGTREEW